MKLSIGAHSIARILSALFLPVVAYIVSACDPVSGSAPAAGLTAVPGWTRFTSADRRYSYAHPPEWSAEPASGQTALFSVANGSAFATVFLDAQLGDDLQAAAQDLSMRLVTQAARNSEQFHLISQQPWSQVAFKHVALETETIEPSSQIRTRSITFLIATPQDRMLFAQYYRLGASDFTSQERDMLRNVIASLAFP
jgi:hypothetical protein